ncbi:AzlC family ABC transporter permease [Weissella minor]|nr:AzlC family ABC transporter permease [Weissella minor]
MSRHNTHYLYTINRRDYLKTRTFSFALKKTLPIMLGFSFLGITYGLYMHQLGFNFLYPTLMAMTIFGGSVEFIIANLLTKAFNPWSVFFLALIVNSRHIFYSISMLERYRGAGWRKPLLIFGLCDETFSINYATELPDDIDKDNFYLYVTMLNYFYWVFGAFLGGVFGSLINVQLDGLDFVMTALFIVIFVDQILREKDHFSSRTGFLIALTCLFIFGDTIFLPISMLIMIIIFYVQYRRTGGIAS